MRFNEEKLLQTIWKKNRLHASWAGYSEGYGELIHRKRRADEILKNQADYESAIEKWPDHKYLPVREEARKPQTEAALRQARADVAEFQRVAQERQGFSKKLAGLNEIIENSLAFLKKKGVDVTPYLDAHEGGVL